MTAPDRPSPPPGRRPVARRRRPTYDPLPTTPVEWAQQVWVVGMVAVVVVTLLVIFTGPSDLSILRRLFVWFSTFAFGIWLLREHRRRIPVKYRQMIFVVCAGCLALLTLVLIGSAF